MGLPISLQQLVQATEYPPEAPTLMFNEATKVVMIVDTVSPTPYALLRRAKNFEYREDDRALQQFANYDDPVRALTDECRRVLRCISSTNQSNVSTSKASTSLRDASWSRFEDVGFDASFEQSDGEDDGDGSMLGPMRHRAGLRRNAHSFNGDAGRPTTPSWADFLSTGFTEENGNKAASAMLLPPGKVLPPIQIIPRGQSSQSHRRNPDTESNLEPGELASIEKVDLDDSFWWVWISSLAGEETTSRKAVFGRCALIETVLSGGKWMIMEEQVKGAAPAPAPGAYIAEKKGFFGFTTRRGRLTGRKSASKKSTLLNDAYSNADSDEPIRQTTITPEQHARIQAAAVELLRRNQEQERLANGACKGVRRRTSKKTNSVITLQPVIMTEAAQAMKWASQYDKKDTRANYLGDGLADKGSTSDLLSPPAVNGLAAPDSSISLVKPAKEDELPRLPEQIPLPKSPTPPPQELPMPKLPVPSPPREYPLPKTPSPPPQQSSPLPLQPVPPPSNTVSQMPLPARSTQGTYLQTAAPHNPKITATPLPPSPIVTHSRSSEPQPAVPRKALGSSAEVNLLKKRNAATGIKGIFGSRRAKQSSLTPPVSPPIENSPAIAAARAALASTNKSQLNGQSVHQAITLGSRETSIPITNPSQRPATPPMEPTYQTPDIPPASDSIPRVVAVESRGHPSKTRRGPEEGSLRRVDTNEREDADRAFSAFDQGPLLEQPALVPPESPISPESAPNLEKGQDQQVPGAFNHRMEEEKDKSTDLVREISPVQDRWAQIRKNAAERAARQNEEQGRPSEMRTDDDETSGEESKSKSSDLIWGFNTNRPAAIESRVARIKARVAELTGNIEASRR